jgi:hypothetical protein
MTTHVPGVAQWAFDESTFLWNVWYFKHALVDQLATPLHSDLIWYPLGIDLILYTYNFFHALLVQPLMLAVNLPFGSNVALLLSTVLSGYGTFLLVRYLLARPWSGLPRLDPAAATFAAVGAGLLYAFGSNRAIYAMLGHYDMVTTQWIPFYALALLRSLDPGLTPKRRIHAALWAGFFMALNGLAEMITALFLAIFTLLVLLAALWARPKPVDPGAPRTGWLNLIRMPAIAAATAALIWSPVLIPILVQFLTDDFSLQGWGEAIPLSTDLLGFFTPTVLHPVWGHDVVTELRRVQLRALELGVVGFRDVNTVFIGWVSALLALFALIRFGRRLRIWNWTALIFGIFCLGPFLQIYGQFRFDLDGIETSFPLPFALLHYLPVIKANRAPNRNSVLLMLGLAVLVGYALAWLLQTPQGRQATALMRRPQSWIAGLLCALILFEHLALPLPLTDARIPAVYTEIAADPEPISVLQVPLGWRNSFEVFGPEKTLLQYYQTAHAKPMLGGNISRAPDFKMDYFRRIPLFAAMEAVQFGRDLDPAQVELAQAQAADLMYLYNTSYVLLYPPIPQRYPYADHWEATWDFVKQTLPLAPEPFWTDAGIEAYRVVQPAGSDRWRLTLGEGDTFAYQGEGWDAAATDTIYDLPALWATDHTSRLFIPLRQVDGAATYAVSARLHPFAYPGAPAQSVGLRVNGTPYSRNTLDPTWQTVTWAVSGADLINGLNRLELQWEHIAAPRTVIGGDRSIGSTGVQLPLDADLKAFADGGYIALFDDAGLQRDGSAGRRGINVTVINELSGDVEQMMGFDTTANAGESADLATFVNGLATGRMVLVVSYGDAWRHLTPEAVDALQGVGLGVTLEEMQEQYLAGVGVRGAAPNSGVWTVHPDDAFVSISLNRDRRTLAAAVDWVEVAPQE